MNIIIKKRPCKCVFALFNLHTQGTTKRASGVIPRKQIYRERLENCQLLSQAFICTCQRKKKPQREAKYLQISADSKSLT